MSRKAKVRWAGDLFLRPPQKTLSREMGAVRLRFAGHWPQLQREFSAVTENWR